MAWHVAAYDVLIRLAIGGFVVLAIAAMAVMLLGEPARRVRVIQWTLGGLVILPLLALVPGYPRWLVLPDAGLGATQGRGRVSARRELADSPAPSGQADAKEEGKDVSLGETHPRGSRVEIEDSQLLDLLIERADQLPPSEESQGYVEPPATMHTPMSTEAASTGLESGPSSPLRGDFRLWVVAAYLAGVGVMGLWSLVGLLAVKRLLRTARPADQRCRDMLRQIAGPKGERVALVESSRVQQPCAVAWRPTTIVLPELLCAPDNAQRLRWALAHEWSHVEHGDVWTWSLAGVVRCVYFYQPLVWVLRRHLQLCQDYVADAQAARAGSNAEDYAEFLTSSWFTNPNPPLAAGLGIGGRATDLTRRVVMLVERPVTKGPLESTSPRRWNLAVMTIAVVLLAAVGTIAAREEVSDPGKTVPPKTPTSQLSPETPRARSQYHDPGYNPYAPHEEYPPSVITPREAERKAPDTPRARSQYHDPGYNPYLPHEEHQPSAITPLDAEPKAPTEAGTFVIDSLAPEEKAEDSSGTVDPDAPPALEPKGERPQPGATPEPAAKSETKPRPGGDQSAERSSSDHAIDLEMNRDPLIFTMTQKLAELHAVLALEKAKVANPDRSGRVLKLQQQILDMQEKIEEMKANLRPKLRELKKAEEEKIETAKKLIRELAEKYEKLEKELAAELETTLESQRVKDLQKQLEEAQGSLPQGIKDLRKNLDETMRELQRAMKARDQAMMERQRRQESEALARFRADQQQRDAEAARQQKRRRDPSQPFKLEPGDIVNIAVEPEDKSLLRSGRIVVEHGGTLPLGPKLGRVQVAGKSLEEAESLVVKVLEEELREPRVQLTYGGRSVDGTTNPESPALESLRQEIEELRQTIRDLRSGKLPGQIVPTERK